MREIQGITAEADARRRWFHDDYFDLFIWQIPSGEVTRFQLCYGISSSERALVWDKQHGFFHDGARTGGPGAGDVIGGGTAGKAPAADPVLSRFNAAAGSLPAEIHQLVAMRILEYVERKHPAHSRRRHFRRASWQQRLSGRS